MDKLKQPSTWAGLASFAALLTNFMPANYQWIGYALTALGSSLAIHINEAA